ncbi:MAG: hypothetical protein JWR69_88 [Pedosphaera sp.]|nr:hypothetical protein [Pedosphaera sp.]
MSDRIPGRSLAAQGLSLPPIRSEEKSLSPDMTAWARGDDGAGEGGGAKLSLPYAQSAWVYIAVSRLAEKVGQIPFRISRVPGQHARRVRALRSSADPKHRRFCARALGETIIDSGDVVDLFNRPHPTMPRNLFWEMMVTTLALRGEFFVLPLDNADAPVDLSESNPKVSRLITLPTELFWHVVTGYDLTSWRYTGSPLLTPIPSELLLPSEVIHCRTPNPYSFWRGMSPLIVAMVAAGSDYAASQYSKGYWLNNADTGVIVTTEQQASTEQQAAILAALRERKRKAGTADRPLFLWGGAKVEKPQLSGMESQFIANRQMNREEIGAIFKVPQSVMGFSQDKASSLSGGGSAINAEEISFIANTIGPMCSRIESSLAPVVMTFGEDLVGWFDLDSLPIMQQARRERLDSAGKAFNLGAAFNDINLAYDLGFPEYAWGNKSYLPFNLQEVGAAEELPGEDPAEPDADDEAKSNPFARMQKLLAGVSLKTEPVTHIRKPDTKVLWQSHVATRRKSVKLFKAKVGKVMMEYRGKTLAKLAEIHLDKGFEKKSMIDLIFNQHDFGAALVAELHNPILSTLQLAGDELHQEVGKDDPWKMAPKAAKDFLAARQQPIMGVGGTVRDQLNTTLEAGIQGGESTKELSDRVRSVFTGLTNHEAERVARTEVSMAYNTARHDAMTESGIDFKAWLSSHGPTVRETHAVAEQEYIETPIPIDEPFEVGGEELMFPGDDSLGASLDNLINCQCIQLAAQKKEEDEKSVTFLITGLGERKFMKAGAQ